MGKQKERKFSVPLYDPQTGEVNPLYTELTGEPNPLQVIREQRANIIYDHYASHKKSTDFVREPSDYLIPTNAEYKMINRWLIEFPESLNIKSYCVTNSSRPLFVRRLGSTKIEPLVIQFSDIIGEDVGKKLLTLMDSGDLFDYKILLLDPVGVKVEEWSINGCEITSINFGEINYTKNGLSVITVDLKCESAILH